MFIKLQSNPYDSMLTLNVEGDATHYRFDTVENAFTFISHNLDVAYGDTLSVFTSGVGHRFTIIKRYGEPISLEPRLHEMAHLYDEVTNAFEFARNLRRYLRRIWGWSPTTVFSVEDYAQAQTWATKRDEL